MIQRIKNINRIEMNAAQSIPMKQSPQCSVSSLAKLKTDLRVITTKNVGDKLRENIEISFCNWSCARPACAFQLYRHIDGSIGG